MAAPSHKSIEALPWQERGALGPAEAAEVLGVSRRHVYRQIDAGRLKAVRLGERLVIPVAEIFRVLEPSRQRRCQASRTQQAEA